MTDAERAAKKGGDGETSGMVIMSGDVVAWAGPNAILGQQDTDDDETIAAGEGLDEDDDGGPDVVATGEDFDGGE